MESFLWRRRCATAESQLSTVVSASRCELGAGDDSLLLGSRTASHPRSGPPTKLQLDDRGSGHVRCY